MVDKRIYFRKYIRIQEFILKHFGLWPRNTVKIVFEDLNAFFTIFTVSYLFLFTLVTYMFVNFEDKEALVDASYYLLTQMTYVIKLTVFFSKHNKFRTILEQIDSKTFDYQKIHEGFVKKWFRFSDIFIKNYLIVCYTVWVFYIVFPIIDKDEDIILPFNGWFPFDVQHNLIYRGLVYGFQSFGLGSAIAVNVCLDSILTALLNIASAQIEILKYNLENSLKHAETTTEQIENYNIEKIKLQFNGNIYLIDQVELIDKTADDVLYDSLQGCVVHQQAIIRFLSDTEDVFGIGMFTQFVSSGIIICITGLQLVLIPPTSIKFITIMSYFIAIIVQISAYCWNGHDVIYQSSDIVDCCYKIDWYRSSTRVKRMLITMMERSKLSLNIKAGAFFILSITTLTTILRTAYSYFAVLRRVYKDK